MAFERAFWATPEKAALSFRGTKFDNSEYLWKRSVSKQSKWIVRMGRAEWARYTYTRVDGDELQLLGSVQRGSQVGALAMTADGQYFQVVGDFVVPLNRSQILNALEKTNGFKRRAEARVAARAQANSVVIRVKRVRIPVMP